MKPTTRIRLRYWHLRYRVHALSHHQRKGNFCCRCGAKLMPSDRPVYHAPTTDKGSPAQD